MATYCYSNDEGQVVEWQCAMGKAPKMVWSPRRGVFNRDFRAERAPVTRDVNPWEHFKSLKLVCHPKDKVAFEKDAADKGVPTEFGGNEPMLIPQFRDATHRKKYLKAYDLVDYDSYY